MKSLLNHSHGITARGLSNLGNTCYLNVSVQCMLHSQDLYTYFSNENYVKSVNTKKPQGKITKEFGKLLKQLAVPKHSAITPKVFFSEFTNFYKEFRGNFQHDSHHCIKVLLDALHEGLNNSSSDQTIHSTLSLSHPTLAEEQEASDTMWDNIQGNVGSVISSLFGGLNKREIVCMNCKARKVIFEIFLDLSVPVPIDQTGVDITVKFVPSNSVQIQYFHFSFAPEVLLEKIFEKITACSGVPLENLVFSHSEGGCLDGFLTPFTLNDMVPSASCTLYAFQITNSIEEIEKYGHSTIQQHKKNWREIIFNNDLVDYYKEGLGWVPGRVIDIKGRGLRIQLETENTEEVAISVDDPNLAEYREKTSNEDKILFLPLSYMRKIQEEVEFFGTPLVLSIGNWYTWEELYRIIIQTTLKRTKSYRKCTDKDFTVYILNRSSKRCGLCDRLHCQGCEFPLSFQRIQGLELRTNQLMIVVFWKEPYSYESPSSTEIDDLPAYTLDACLQEFTLEEQIEVNCEQCEFTSSKTRIEIWKLPDVLIIHLKRFRRSQYGITKINNLVSFPLRDFDITEWMFSRKKTVGIDRAKARENHMYDLFGVINHHGNANSGHYTSSCLRQNGEWLEFSDEEVVGIPRATEQAIISPQAYILFYKRQVTSSNSLIVCMSPRKKS